MHNKTTWNKKIFASKLNSWYEWYLSKDGVGHYAINPILFLTMVRGKFVKMYERHTNQLRMYTQATKVLLKVYLTISLLPPSKLNDILGKAKKVLWVTNPNYDTGGSHLSRTAVKLDSHLARIFVAKFLCIIKLIITIG